jgi:hypothetical protein
MHHGLSRQLSGCWTRPRENRFSAWANDFVHSIASRQIHGRLLSPNPEGPNPAGRRYYMPAPKPR